MNMRKNEKFDDGAESSHPRSNAFDDWLHDAEGLSIHEDIRLEVMSDGVPLRTQWFIEALKETFGKIKGGKQSPFVTELSDEENSAWNTLHGLEREVLRLQKACQKTTGSERESNLRQMKDAASELDKHRKSQCFKDAVRSAISYMELDIKAKGDQSRFQVSAVNNLRPFLDAKYPAASLDLPSREPMSDGGGSAGLCLSGLERVVKSDSVKCQFQESKGIAAPDVGESAQNSICLQDKKIYAESTVYRPRVGWQIALFDAWPEMRKLYGRNPTAAEAIKYLKLNDKSGVIVGRGAVNELWWVPNRRDAKEVAFSTVENTISKWRTQRLLPT